MPYPIAPTEVNRLAKLLTDYYERELEGGIRATFDRMAQANMGLITAKIDLAKDTVASIRKAGTDKFTTTFTARLRTEFRIQTGNHSELMSYGVQMGTAVLKMAFKHIPLPHVGTALTAVLDLASKGAQSELHKRSVLEADKDLAERAGTAQATALSTHDTDVAAAAASSIELYKEIAKLVVAMPTSISSFDDAITYPGVVWRTQKAASALKVALWGILDYLRQMEERTAMVEKLAADGVQRVRTEMGSVVSSVLDKSYDDGWRKGNGDVQTQKYQPLAMPVLGTAGMEGAASQLAVYVAHAFSMGYYNAGNSGPFRLRSNAVTAPPPPAAPGRPRAGALSGSPFGPVIGRRNG